MKLALFFPTNMKDDNEPVFAFVAFHLNVMLLKVLWQR